MIDTRAAVGHLTRNIRIENGRNSSWGYCLLIYQDDNCNETGSVKMSSVELINGGKDDLSNSYRINEERWPAVKFYHVKNSSANSHIIKSSIHHCKYNCLVINGATNLDISTNVFAHGKKFIVNFIGTNIHNLDFSKNLMLNPQKANKRDQIACF